MTAKLGVEEEFHLVDPWTGEVRGGAAQVLAALPDGEKYKPELMMSAVETNSGVCATLEDLRADVTAARAAVIAAAQRIGLAVMAAGAAPLVGTTPIGITPNDRNAKMHRDYQILAQERLICGLQVHVDCSDRDLAVRAMAQTDFFGDSGELQVLAQACVADGGSAQRQRRAVAETGEVRSAVELLCSETAGTGREARDRVVDLSAGSAAPERV